MGLFGRKRNSNQNNKQIQNNNTNQKNKPENRQSNKSIQPPQKNNSQKQDNKKKSVDIGQTLETNDLYLPYKESRKPKSKSRPVIVADKVTNPIGEEEFAVIPGSTKKTQNTTKYGNYGIDYYRHNIEVEDDEGKPISLNNKFQITKNCSKLPEGEVNKIRDTVLNHTRFSSENRKKYDNYKNKYK